MTDVVIVGAGLAGLVCAADLSRAGFECVVLEASDGIGGRVRTDVIDGFTLDRGFQIVLAAYPQVRRRLDLDALALGKFAPGAVVRTANGMYRVADPRRRPRQLPEDVKWPVASAADKLRAVRLVLDVWLHSAPDLLRRPDMSTAARLRRAGFSDAFITAFWRPLFAGIQLDPELEVSARRFEVVLRTLALGATGLPRGGLQAFSEQLVRAVPAGVIRLGAPASAVRPGAVTLAGGEEIAARAVVVATDAPAAHRLLGDRVPDPGSRPAACCWFAVAAPPVRGPHLILDGEGDGPALNVVVMSEVQPTYAPAGRALIAAAVPGAGALGARLQERVREQLQRWFGGAATDFEPLRTDMISHGQPDQRPPLHPRQRVHLGEGVFVCGDHRDTASQQGAMFSGERAAAAVVRHLLGPSRS